MLDNGSSPILRIACSNCWSDNMVRWEYLKRNKYLAFHPDRARKS